MDRTKQELLLQAIESDAVIQDDSGNIPDNYLIVLVKVGDKFIRALVDTGAQPTCIKRSCVPIGTPIQGSDMYVKGVRGPKVKVSGLASIWMEGGRRLFNVECVVIPDTAIDFPDQCGIIMGVNMMASNEIDVSHSRWSLTHKNQVLQNLEPAKIDGKLFSAAERDYIAHGFTDRMVEANTLPSGQGLQTLPREEQRYASSDQGSPRDLNNNMVYGQESPSPDKVDEEARSRESQQQSCGDKPANQSQKAKFHAATVANISLQPSSMNMIKISIRDDQGLPAPVSAIYGLDGGYIRPGVIALNGVTRQRDTIAVMNFTKESIPLYKEVPISPAEVISEEDILVWGDPNHKLDLQKPEVYSLLTMAAITEEADVWPQEYASDTDELQTALEYDPSQMSTEEVVYDSHRASQLLDLLGAPLWKLSKSQRRAAESMIRRRQKAFNLKGEPLPCTHLIEHNIQLKDPNQVVHIRPRWTPIHQRPHVEKELKGLLDQGLAVPTSSPHNSPIVLVRKKGGSWRFWTDFRFLNSKSVGSWYPVCNIEEILFRISQSKIHSRFDMRSGFMQIPMGEASQPISAFSCHKGHFMYKRLPFGLSSGPHTLNKLMDIAF